MSVVFTPPQLAKRWAVSPDKVRHWITTDQLSAANLGDATRPRWRILEADAETFWQQRQTRKQPPKRTRRKIEKPVRRFL